MSDSRLDTGFPAPAAAADYVVGAHAVIVERFNPLFPSTPIRYTGCRDYIWWSYSLGALKQLILNSGFRRVDLRSTFKIGKDSEIPWKWQGAFEVSP